MKFTYRCPQHGVFEAAFPPGRAPRSLLCVIDLEIGTTQDGFPYLCCLNAPRYFAAETLPQIRAQDAFRRFDLSPRKEAAQVTQQRYLDAPRDGAEARANEQARGISYVGDDTSGMTAGARRGIEKHRSRVRSGEIKT